MPYNRHITKYSKALFYLGFAYLCLTSIVLAQNNQAPKVTVLIKENSNLHRQFSQNIISEHKATVQVINYTNLNDQKKHLIIALGNDICRYSVEKYKQHQILCALIPSAEFIKIKSKADSKIEVGAIYVDQPFQRRIDFIHSHFPELKKIAIMTANDKKQGQENIHFYKIDNTKRIFQEIKKIKHLDDVILAIENREIYNNKSIRTILLQSYRNRLPIIGFSNSFTKAGAIASIYSSIEDLSKEANEYIEQYNKDLIITLPQKHPKYYSKSFNKQVARTLKIKISGEDFE